MAALRGDYPGAAACTVGIRSIREYWHYRERSARRIVDDTKKSLEAH